ncbi:MAG: MarR family transcriptional regulator [Spirochaetes bacterium]|nr:MarR family transcriptional regulator [Spirochaetota bacterium]
MIKYSNFEKYFRHLAFKVKIEGRKALKDYPDITKAMFETLQLIYFNKSLKAKDIASNLDISRPAASEILTKLEKYEYIQKTKNPKDNRETYFSLSKKGEKVINSVIKQRVKFIKQIFKEEEIVEISKIFKDILKRFKKSDQR